mgnify:CR=1 FL=1
MFFLLCAYPGRDAHRLVRGDRDENAMLFPPKAAAGGGEEKEDPLFLDAIGVAFEFETMSTSLLQRRLSVGYSRAQKMIDMMEARGYVGKFDTQTKKRKIVITFEEYQQLRLNKESAE